MAGVRMAGSGRAKQPRRRVPIPRPGPTRAARLSWGGRAPEFRLDWVLLVLAWMLGGASPLGLTPLGLAAAMTSAAGLASPQQDWAVAVALAVGAGRHGLAMALETAGVTIALVLCHRLLRLGQGRAPWLAAGWAALVLGGGTSAVLAWGQGPAGIVVAGVQALVAFGGTVLFQPALAWLGSRHRAVPQVAKPLPVAGLLLLVGLALGGLGGLGAALTSGLPGRLVEAGWPAAASVLDAQRLVLDFLVMLAGCLGGPAWGALAGVVLSCLASLSGPLDAGTVGAYALGGVLAGAGRRGGRALSALAFLAGLSLLSLAEVPLSGLPVPAAQAVLAGGAMLLVPRRALVRTGALPRLVGSALGWGGAAGSAGRAAAAALEEVGSALRELARLARPGPDAWPPPAPSPSAGAVGPAAVPAGCRQCPAAGVARGQLEGVSRILLDLAREVGAAPAVWASRPEGGGVRLRWEGGAEGVALGPEPSGDAFLVREFPGGRLLVALSDGVGHGSRARELARTLLGLLGRLLAAGLGLQPVVAALNAAMLLRPGSEALATLDLWWVDLVSGQAEYVKFGAPPGCLRRGGRIETLASTAPPVGGAEEAVPDTGVRTVGPGDVLLLVTDGALGSQAGDARWIRDFLADNWTLPPKRLVSALLQRAQERSAGGLRDDASAVAVRFLSR
ncbi:MAG: SpoIIE family protein phosphatase [Acetobacteraceae bacterium]|nr:SpoIIE family protein phosphatase [Acetobacteraceae bacterium]